MITRFLSKALLVASLALLVPAVSRPALAATAQGRRPHHRRHHHARPHARHHTHGRAAQQPHEL